MDENLESSSQHSGATAEAASRMLDSSLAAPVGRASPRAAVAKGVPIEDGSRGDETAFREFYNAYFDRLLRYLLVVTGGDEQAAREALQAALVRVVRHVKLFDAEEKFWSWLTVLARTALADETRKHRRYFAFLDRFTRQQETIPTALNNGEADEQLRALLESKLTALPADERQLVEQKYLLRQSVRDIADGQQTTEKTVESKLSRVRRKLKDAVLADLKRTGGEPLR